MSDMISNHALTSNSVWPFVTLPFFEMHAQRIRNISSTNNIIFHPLVPKDSKASWESYAAAHTWWFDDDNGDYYTKYTKFVSVKQSTGDSSGNTRQQVNISKHIHGAQIKANTTIPSHLYAPIWQLSPPSPGLLNMINYDVLSIMELYKLYRVMEDTKSSVLSRAILHDSIFVEYTSRGSRQFFENVTTNGLRSNGMRSNMSTQQQFENPHSSFFQPVFKRTDGSDSAVVAFVQAIIPWHRHLSLLYQHEASLIAILSNKCGQTFSFTLNKNGATYLGRGDQHIRLYGAPSGVIEDILVPPGAISHATVLGCRYSLHIYPSVEYYYSKRAHTPRLFTILLASCLATILLVFFMYQRYVLRRTSKLLETAERSNKLLSSLFPGNVHERLFASISRDNSEDELNSSRHSHHSHQSHESSFLGGLAAPASRLKSYLKDNVSIPDNEALFDTDEIEINDKPIADLFLNVTVLYSDIVGFTAWSSMRDPSQVFKLLETLFCAFDDIAMRLGVFKVETIGDCYVAVSGMPEPNKDHAVIMAKFAWESNLVMQKLMRNLEATLGPDTGELSMRTGLHSGPVTAGVLRGERSRFQLFGDTVRRVAQIESSCEKGKIQLSQETATLIIEAGNFHWVELRDKKIKVKGDDELTTYWLTHVDLEIPRSSFRASDGDGMYADPTKSTAEKQGRSIDFILQILELLLKQIVARRKTNTIYHYKNSLKDPAKAPYEAKKGQTVLEEVKEVISLPKFDARSRLHEDPEAVVLMPAVTLQLRDYVTSIANLYRQNPFHNFDHACHVSMSVVKLLTRIVAPTCEIDDHVSDQNIDGDMKKLKATIASKMHDHTYGITSDPLTQFSVVLSALIHDVDHSGVPNPQLVKENPELSSMYKGQSVAEQNSVDLSWDLLMRPCYADLRNVIASTKTEWERFRQLTVNSVMATDIADKELKKLRNDRWDKAFGESPEEDTDYAINRKATIVIEHLIQASDVSHTMQHWHVFLKWNKRLFLEMYTAYKDGRAEKDPSEFWYNGEKGFFDYYIIPLAKKLKDCGVFGVSSDEYLNYAMKNREEWEQKGEFVVAEYISEVCDRWEMRKF